MKKAIELVGVGPVLSLSKGTGLHIRKKLIHLDELPDETWRMTFTGELLPAAEVLLGISFDIQGRAGMAKIEYEGHPPLEMRISRVAPIAPPPMPEGGPRVPFMMHFDQGDDGTWKLLYSKALIPDISKLSRLQVVREG